MILKEEHSKQSSTTLFLQNILTSIWRLMKKKWGGGDPQPRPHFHICRGASKRCVRFGAESGPECRESWLLRDEDGKKEQEEEEKEVAGAPKTSNNPEMAKCQAAIQPAKETRGKWENERGREKVADDSRKQRQCMR